ncbi:MAG: hypothetical protein VW080_06325, partial [Flavobacteriaceae bacterium]
MKENIKPNQTSPDSKKKQVTSMFDGISKSALELSSGYSITVVTSDTYTFTVAESSTTGNIKGGGDFATAG